MGDNKTAAEETEHAEKESREKCKTKAFNSYIIGYYFMLSQHLFGDLNLFKCSEV